jgi:hypothetical protein
MKNRKTHRLPAYDSRTSRSELFAFSSLGLVGAALVAAAVSSAMKFAEARQDIVSALSFTSATPSPVANRPPDQTFTNVLRVRATVPTQDALINHTASPASQPQPL